MTVPVLRRRKAVQDAEEIVDYIAKDNLEAAIRFLQSAESTVRDLAEFPSDGSPRRLDDRASSGGNSIAVHPRRGSRMTIARKNTDAR